MFRGVFCVEGLNTRVNRRDWSEREGEVVRGEVRWEVVREEVGGEVA